ncbi:MAG: efflux transporter outer membrane subunit [Brachymonas sp.]|nr:efflux transporter outer membrane subunit [Brachymonas sp.]
MGAALAAVAVLTACVSAPPTELASPVPERWRAPVLAGQPKTMANADPDVPHSGSVEQLLNWWGGWNDPLLVDLIAAAQGNSPSLASAAARIAQARLGETAATAAMLPTLGGAANVTRAPMTQAPFAGTIVNTHVLGAQLQWEIDLFGGLNHARRASGARLNAAQAAWHDARVSLAADVANQYFGLRACQRGLEIVQADVISQQETARLTAHLERAGFAAPATLALAEAGAAQAQVQRLQLEAQCTAAIKGLSTLTAMDEDILRARLQQPASPQPPPLMVASVPAQVLAQRPDVYAAAQALAAASGDVGHAKTQRLPHLTFSGNIGRTLLTSALPQLDNTRMTVWSVGPLGLSMPLFDWGRISANVHSNKVQYEAAALQYHAALRNAVRDVETALVNLHSARERQTSMQVAVRGFEKSFTAANAKYKAGMGSMLELENARRNLNMARQGQSQLQQQTESAWVALYRALGGGWTPAANPTRADHDLIEAGEATRRAQQARPAAQPAPPTSSTAAHP